ncbi:MAG TPA: CopG family transcriptional regulator [Acidobacteriaceae bacterium]|nr:CopG family transcriptional regulator [Acidobacteriaceae bacterium]
MKRTQLYLDDDLWKALHSQARREKTTVSDLVRRAARDRYLGGREERARAMQAWVGVWKDRDDLPDTEQYVRNLRDDDRLERLRELREK